MDGNKLNRIRKAFKVKMSKYEIISNFSDVRGVAAFIDKNKSVYCK